MVPIGSLRITDAINAVTRLITANSINNNSIVQYPVIGILHLNTSNQSPLVSACLTGNVNEIAEYVNLSHTIKVLRINTYVRTIANTMQIIVSDFHIIGRPCNLYRISSAVTATTAISEHINAVINNGHVIQTVYVNRI